MDDLLEFFNKYENVMNVNRRTWVDKDKDKTRHFKGSVFVTFKDKESAEKFMALESVKSPEGVELIRKWQSDYFKEKEEEYKLKKEQKGKEKKSKKDVQEKQNEKDESEAVAEVENTLPKGAVMFMDGFKDDTMREDIKKVLDCDDAIAFIDFERGKTSGYIRFKEENAAKELLEKLQEKYKDEKLKVKEAEIEYRVLEGDEESEYLVKAANDIKERQNKNRGHKRKHGGRGGRGGRGGKRGRY